MLSPMAHVDVHKERLIVTRFFVFGAAVVMVLGAAGGTHAQQLGAGDPAPAFELPGTDGNTHRLADYQGRTVVLAWFTKAFTGG